MVVARRRGLRPRGRGDLSERFQVRLLRAITKPRARAQHISQLLRRRRIEYHHEQSRQLRRVPRRPHDSAPERLPAAGARQRSALVGRSA